METKTLRPRLVERSLLTKEQHDKIVNLFRNDKAAMEVMLLVIGHYIDGLCDIRSLKLNEPANDKQNVGFIACTRYWASEYLTDFFDELMGYRELSEKPEKPPVFIGKGAVPLTKDTEYS